MDYGDLYEKGLKIRREVLGAEYVDQSIANADDFTRDLARQIRERFVARNEEGVKRLQKQGIADENLDARIAVWSRETLDRRTRSIINLSMITALNRPHELKLHVKGALNNGLSREEIREVLLHTAIYCGVPAAIDSFRNAREVFEQIDKDEGE